MSNLEHDRRPAKYAELLAQGIPKTRAALIAGYTRQQARTAHHSIERRPAVRRALARYAERAEMTAVRSIEQLRRLAFYDVRRLFDENGNLKPISSLSDEDASMIAGVEIIKKNAEAGDGHIDVVHKIKLVDKVKPLELALRYHHLIDEHVQVDTDVRVTVSWQKPELPEGAHNVIDVTPTTISEADTVRDGGTPRPVKPSTE